MRLRLSLSTGLALVPVLLVLFAVGVLGWRYTSELKSDQARINHSEDVLDAAQTVMLDVEDAETSQRGFVITGRLAYLQLNLHAAKVLPADLDRLQALSTDTPADAAAMATLRNDIDAKMFELNRVVVARRDAGFAAAAAIVDTDVGFHDMDNIRAMIQARIRSEIALQQSRNSIALKTGETASLTVLLATLAGLAVALFLGIKLVREEKLRAKAAFAATIAANDIAASQQKEIELAHHIAALERSNRELDEFAHIASHDLKEPLRGLYNNAKFLQEDYGDKIDEEGAARLARMRYLCQRMEALINDLLYFSRLGRQEIAVQSTDLNAVIRDIETMTETTLNERNATIVMPAELPRTECDKTRIGEVFRNLIVNAVKYNDSPTKQIEVGYREEVVTKRGVEKNVFYVKDNGVGIAEEFHEDIFGIFKRLNVEEDDKKGNGVGLTFVRKIIERHGGRVWLDSAPEAGSIFYFTIGQGQANDATA